MRYVERRDPRDGSRCWLPDEPGLREALAAVPAHIPMQFAWRAAKVGDGPWVSGASMASAVFGASLAEFVSGDQWAAR